MVFLQVLIALLYRKILIRQGLSIYTEPQFYFERGCEFAPDRLTRPETFELSSFRHNSHFRAQSFCLFHRVCRNNYCTILYISDNRPHTAASIWVKTGTWFVKENNWRVSDKSYSYTELSFITTREVFSIYILFLLQPKVVN